MSWTRTSAGIAILGLFLANPSELRASEPEAGAGEDGAARVAIQRLKYRMSHELALSAGLLPLDAFQKGYAASLSYSIHFSEVLAWEVFHVTGALLASTKLRDELIDTFAVPPEDFNAPRLIATTGVEFSPFYGKQAFLNDSVIHQAVFVGAHGGVIFGDRGAFSDTLEDLRPAVGLGLGWRIFLSRAWSVRLDVRDFLSYRRALRDRDRAEFENVLFLSGAIALNFGRDDA